MVFRVDTNNPLPRGKPQGEFVDVRDRSRNSHPLGFGIWKYVLCVVVLYGGIPQGGAQNANHIVLTPLGRGGKEVALLIVPEVGLENTAYEELGKSLKSFRHDILFLPQSCLTRKEKTLILYPTLRLI